MSLLSINSIYRATEGEGILIGSPQTFVRFQGCAVGCLNCDSMDTWSFDSPNMSLDEVLESVRQEGLKRVSITGGDPLHPKLVPQVVSLIKELKQRRYWINIEAAGTRVVDEVFDLVDFVSIDFKTPSTGVKTNLKVLEKMQSQYAGKFQIKSVVANEEDFREALRARESFDVDLPWVLTPSFEPGEEFPQERFVSILQWNELAGGYFRVIGQQHKWIFGPDKKQV